MRIAGVILAAAMCLSLGGVAAVPEKPKKLTCCEEAAAKKEECKHRCCINAHAEKKSCLKCNPNQEDLKLKKAPKGKK